MIVVWSGRGFLSLVVLITSFILLNAILPKEHSDYKFIISFLITGAFSWFMGKKWNEKKGKTLIDKESGHEVIIKSNHSLFWIKMQYWGPIFWVLGLVILVQKLI